jgi:hypothetical protein
LKKAIKSRPVKLAELAARIIDPVAAKRGFATSELISAWPDIIGNRFAASTRPERITWPPRDPDAPGVLVLKVEGPVAILLQHELQQLVERINVFMGYQAIDRIRLIQGPVGAGEPARGANQSTLTAAEKAQLDGALSQVDDDELRSALERLGRGVLSESG